MRNIQNRFWLSPDEDGGGIEQELMDLTEDPNEAPEEVQPEQEEQSAPTLDQAFEVLRAAGMTAVPESMVSQQQQQAGQQAIDYASQIQVPEEVIEQGWEAEQNYRVMAGSQMAIQAAMAPMMSQQAAAQIASSQNRPELAQELQMTMEQTLGPNWAAEASNPQLKPVLDLMIEGFMAKKAGQTPKDAAPIPRQEGVGRKAQPNAALEGHSALDMQRLQEMSKEMGISVEELVS